MPSASSASSRADENLALHEQQEKLQKQIAKLEKQARAEKQPKKKFELANKVKELKKKLNALMITEEKDNGQAQDADSE